MATYVLVHGAWHGSWCWKKVRSALWAQGHQVFTPSLTGMADRIHLLGAQVDLETHITDVLNLIISEELEDVILCGHSYAGGVISGVADRIPDRVSALVYLDAFILESGQSLHDVMPQQIVEMQVEAVRRRMEDTRSPTRSDCDDCEREGSRVGGLTMHPAAAGHPSAAPHVDGRSKHDQECDFHPCGR